MGKPIYIKVERELAHPLAQVWKAVALEYGDVANYNPALKASRLESDVTSGAGMRRHCDFPKKGYIKEEITDWKDGEYFELQMLESSVPLKIMRSKLSFRELDGGTHLTQEFWYRMKAPMGWLSGMMKGKMKQTLEVGLAGLDEHLSKSA